MIDLPEFPYHPDPLRTGSVKPSDQPCVLCGRASGYVYTGPVYCEQDLDGRLCPWCIADGSAAETLDANFCDGAAPLSVDFDAIFRRTPGFSAWQQTYWLFHCGDGAAFLGPVGAKELRGDDEALASLRADLSGWPEDQVEGYLSALDRDGRPTAYLFVCRTCRTHLAYSDAA